MKPAIANSNVNGNAFPATAYSWIAAHLCKIFILIIPGLLLIGCWTCGTAGLSRYFATQAFLTRSLVLADKAIRLSPTDPAGHYVRGLLLTDRGVLQEATYELERAVKLSPNQFMFWQALGRSRSKGGDEVGAIAAYKEAIRLAPYYAQPRWELGTLLLKTGHREDALVELRRAAESDSAFVEPLNEIQKALN